jgi:hypothetical protein
MAIEISQPAGTLLTLWSSWFSMGRAHALRKEWPLAMAAFEEALDIIHQRKTGLHVEPFILSSMAEALLDSGDPVRALATAEDARRSAVENGSRPSWIQARTVLSAARRAAGVADALHEEAELWSCIEMIEQTGEVSLEPGARIEIAELSRLRGDEEAYTRELSRAREIYAEMGATARAAAFS